MYTVCHKVGHEPTGRKLSDFIALCGSLVEKETYLDNMYVVLYRLIHILRKSYCFLTLCVCVLIFFFFQNARSKVFQNFATGFIAFPHVTSEPTTTVQFPSTTQLATIQW